MTNSNSHPIFLFFFFPWMPPFFFFFPILVVSCFKSHPKEKIIIFFLNNLCYVGHMLKFVFNVDKSPCNFKITSQIQNVRTQMVFNETKNQEPMHLSAMVEATNVRFNYHNRQRNTGPPCYTVLAVHGRPQHSTHSRQLINMVINGGKVGWDGRYDAINERERPCFLIFKVSTRD